MSLAIYELLLLCVYICTFIAFFSAQCSYVSSFRRPCLLGKQTEESLDWRQRSHSMNDCSAEER